MLIGVSVLLIAMSLFHSILGERYVLGPIKANNTLPKMWNSRVATFRTIQATWHLVSFLWVGLAAQFLTLFFAPSSYVKSSLIIFAILFAALAIVPFIWETGKHKSWLVFGAISGLLFASAFLA